MLSTVLMREVEAIDPERLCVTVQGGATWKDVADAAAEAGLFLPVMPVLYRSATIGGHLSNGAEGIGTYKYGPLHQWVRSLEVVLPNGQVVETAERDFDLGALNYNLTNLFLGAEGTLGVITKATLRLMPAPPEIAVSAYSFDGIGDMVEGLKQLVRSPARPYHVGLMDGSHLLFQRALLKQVPEAAGMVLLAFDGTKEEVEAEKQAADEVMATGKKEDDEVAGLLWEDRHTPYDARRISGGLVVAEGAVPISNLEEAIGRSVRAAAGIRADAAFHGFLLDRNSAFLAPYILTDERTLRSQLAISFVERFHRILLELDGHPFGLGLLITYNLEPMHGPVAAQMRGIKEALDPKAIVNRGKLLGTMGRAPPFGPPELPPGLMRRGLRAMGMLRRLMPSDRYIRKLRRR
jgi:glycolate oxidase